MQLINSNSVKRYFFLLQLAISTSLARPRIINGEELDDISDYLYRAPRNVVASFSIGSAR
jgi:hypothetical protein